MEEIKYFCDICKIEIIDFEHFNFQLYNNKKGINIHVCKNCLFQINNEIIKLNINKDYDPFKYSMCDLCKKKINKVENEWHTATKIIYDICNECAKKIIKNCNLKKCLE